MAEIARKLVGLAAIVGLSVASALFTATPLEESGRVVEVKMDDAGKPSMHHVRGRQYLSVYLDMVGVATACDGLTGPAIDKARAGKVFTEAECTAMLETALIEHATIVMRCSPGLAVSAESAIERRREGPRFAAVSGNYNHGRYCSSTARARFDVGNYAGGCTALTWFNRAGGRVVRGLVLRRAREHAVCVKGLAVLA
jgi:lysozyme